MRHVRNRFQAHRDEPERMPSKSEVSAYGVILMLIVWGFLVVLLSSGQP